MAEEKRRELDSTFKPVIKNVLAPLPVEVRTEVEVSRLPRKINVLVLAKSADSLHQLRTRSPFRQVRCDRFCFRFEQT